MNHKYINKLVAENIMGGVYACGFCCPKCYSHWFNTSDKQRHCQDEYGVGCCESFDPTEALPRFSEEANESWMVVQALNRKFWNVTLKDNKNGSWFCEFKNQNETFSHTATTEHLAICLAALSAFDL